uniref:Ycf1 n=1 Tax=Ceratopteris pteridoides TaxID=58167 RepID=UPI0021B6D4F4|nr:Ycf1 [Ceratopteris pteridoides]UWI72101.1 Ycf1 [Ceratopteris pteridoides]
MNPYIYILFGLYYGLLATLPVGVPQLLCIRSFLIGGNLSGLASLSGSMLAQLITFLSIYCSPIYLVLSKPHILTVMVIPYTLVFCFFIKDPPDYQLLRPVTSFRDSRLLRLFVLSFLFQIFNPIVLPNPVLTRLPYLFFFRYSTNSLFLIFTFAGWLFGQAAFSYFSKLLLTRVERDSPMLYLLVKRSIYTTFSIVFVSIAVAYLGRAPAPFFTEKYVNQFYAKDLHFWKLTGYKSLFWWAFQPWPFSFFDPTRHNRGHRFVRNSRLYRGKSFVKRRVSTYFFQKCLTDGKERLSFASLPSLAIFEKQICGSLPTRAHSRLGTRLHLLSQTWVLEKLVRTKRVEKELTDRVVLLDNDYSFSKAMEKRTRLKSRKRSRIPQVYDPFVNNFRMRIPIPHTYLTLAELNMKRHGPIKERKLIRRIKNKEYLKDWISKNNRRRKKQYRSVFPWDPLSIRYKRMFQFMYEKGTLYDFKLRKILEKTQKDSSVIWEEMIELNPLSQALFFTYLERENSYYLNTISTLKAFFISNYKTFSNTARQFRLIENSSMRLARNLSIYSENVFDFTGAETAFRYRKLRNIGFTSIRRNRYKWVKRYARVSDFRRKLFKGSSRARRRKTLLWNALQGKIHSSFFLRVREIPLFYLSSNSSVTFKPSVPVVELIKTKNFEVYQQLLENSPALKERLINEESTRTRSALATRTDIGPIHNGRGYLLVFQSKFRKYIKLPTFILFKTIIRFLLRQESEWSKDWTYWRKEIHINCTFDGEEYSRYDLPPRWLREGIQIKVVSPFRLKPWYTDENKKKLSLDQTSMKVESSESQTLINKRKLKRKKPKFIYLTVLGYQTDKPFGPILKETSFWKPVQKKLIRTYQKRRLPRQVRQTYQFINSRLHLEKVVKFSLIVFQKLNFLSKIKLNRKNSNQRTKKLSSTYFKETSVKNNNSIVIGGEIYSTSFYSKPAFNQNFENKKMVESPKVDFVNSIKQEMKQEVKTDNLRKTSINQVAIDTALNNTDFSNSFENLKEFIFSPRLFLAASADEFLVVLKNLLFKIGRSSIYLFYDFVTLHKQLRRLREEINHENNVVPKNGVQLLSQGQLYVDIWNISLKNNLNLDLLINNNIKNSNNSNNRENIRSQGDINQDNNTWSSDFNHSSKFHVLSSKSSSVRLNSTLTEIQNKKENGINRFPIHSDTKIDNQEMPNEILSENTAKYIEEWGFWNKFYNVNDEIWSNWLDCFPKYNLSSIIWREIAPSRWKENLEDFTNLKKITTQNNPRYRVYPGKFHSYSIYTQKLFLRDRINNFNKITKQRILLQNLTDFVRSGDIQNFSVRQDVIRQKSYFKDRFEKISNKRKNISKNLFSFPNSSTRKYNLKFDLMLWLDPKMLKMKGLFTSKNKTRKTKRLLEDKPPYYIFRYGSESDKTRELFKYLFDRGIEDREESDYLFNRKWKLEMQMESFRKLSDITRLLRTEQELMALCENSELDPDLLGFQLRNKNKNRWFRFLGFFYFHRFGNLLDDQSLLYKIVNPLLNVKSIAKKRDKKRLYKNIYNDTYIFRLFHIVNEHNCKQVCNYNIEDLLLTRRQREFRFLNCLVISKQLAQRGEGYLSHIINEIEKTKNDVEEIKNEVKPKPWCLLQDSSIESQRIKRFLWPSHRLEELACTGRFCFGATTESRFAALKIRMYPII